MRWLEILPKEQAKEVQEAYIVYESLERAFQRIRAGGISARVAVGYQGPEEAPGAKISGLMLALILVSRRLVSTATLRLFQA